MSSLPADAQLFEIAGTGWWAIVFEPVPGVKIAYGTQDPTQYDTGGRAWQPVSQEQQAAWGAVAAGDANELTSYLNSGETYGQFFTKLLDQLFSPGDPARTDPGVLKVIGEFAGRPDMAESELMTLLERTDYWAVRTDQQRRWNGLSPAEQQFQIEEWATKLADLSFQIEGTRQDPSAGWIRYWAERIASGVAGQGAFVAHVQATALNNPESPYSRQIRTEQEAQLERGVTIENTTGQLRELARRWGIQMSDESLAARAKAVVEQKESQEDFVQYLKGQAQILYTWKDPEMETLTAAEPWLQTYARVLEKPADLFNADVQSALTAGTPAFEFERQLKGKTEWLETKNAQDSILGAAGTAGRLMGFS